jgi:type IV secretory pathway VirB2 component (pilin)
MFPMKKSKLKALVARHGNNLVVAAAVAAFASVAGAEAALAGTDTTFNTALTQFTNFLEGSGGKVIAALSLAGGIVSLASGRFLWLRSPSPWAWAWLRGPACRSSVRPSLRPSDGQRLTDTA